MVTYKTKMKCSMYLYKDLESTDMASDAPVEQRTLLKAFHGGGCLLGTDEGKRFSAPFLIWTLQKNTPEPRPPLLLSLTSTHSYQHGCSNTLTSLDLME